MGTKTENDHDEAARLDREYTGDAVNARTDELKKELNRETEQLQRKYEESGEPEADGKEG
jgi:hypothetical protein